MSEENVAALRAVYDEWGRGNFTAGLDLYDPRVLLVTRQDLPDADLFVGVEAMTAYMREFLEPVAALTFTAEEFIDAEGSVIVATRQQGMGKTSGVPFEDRSFVVWTFRGRAVVRLEFFSKRSDALEAVGL